MGGFILQYIDILWLPLALLTVPQRRNWPVIIGFFISCMLMMRLQVELMEFIKYPNGLIGVSRMPVLERAQLIYNLTYAGYTAFLVFSKNTVPTLLMATSLAIFFTVMTISMLAMIV